MSFPIPSLSTCFFLLLFYYSINISFNRIKIAIITILWSLFFYIHPIDAIFGITFWLSYSTISIYYRKINYNIILTFKHISIQIFIILIFIGYSILNYEFSNLENVYTEQVSIYYFFSYFFIPSFMIILLFLIKKIDPYEILIKFHHIYILMLIEFILHLFFIFSDFAIDVLILKNRIALFFLHIYYYVPIIYYCNKPSLNFNKNQKSFFYSIDNALYIFFNKLSNIYLPLFMILLYFYIFFAF